MEKEFVIPVVWTVAGKVKMKASSWDEAVQKAQYANLPDDFDYVEGSFQVDHGRIELDSQVEEEENPNNYTGDEEVTRIIWSVGDIISKMEQLGIDPTKENLDRFLESRSPKTLNERSTEEGWGIIDTLLIDEFHNDRGNVDRSAELRAIYEREVPNVAQNYLADELVEPLTEEEIQDVIELILADPKEIAAEFYLDVTAPLYLSEEDDFSEVNSCIANVIRYYRQSKTLGILNGEE